MSYELFVMSHRSFLFVLRKQQITYNSQLITPYYLLIAIPWAQRYDFNSGILISPK